MRQISSGLLRPVPMCDWCFECSDEPDTPVAAMLQKVEIVYDKLDIDDLLMRWHGVYHYKCVKCGKETQHSDHERPHFRAPLDEMTLYNMEWDSTPKNNEILSCAADPFPSNWESIPPQRRLPDNCPCKNRRR